ncbi:FAD-dependent monooxygenase [Alicyclobacillus acidocaldarius]|uniref:Monooxygenase FAD-binding protein n=1 Tax=Alicyclobacillus acidocaldarius (strain Tc-4-1) TaxID=1048834 RepID=F8ICS8_ALIAT|nr:FAD-dependent monooxygenase [Alicyclobacillus acidocaldarius]AEJ43743.1 monooxygenase FAD-binding protein [Alicyclobacillus acidocaldarius subsp. acidocaldarius Tc-4-1]
MTYFGEDRSKPVLVVGAGPVGLTAALALRRYNIPVVVLEAEPQGRLRPGSRAIFIHRATLQLLEAVYTGLGFTLARHGLVWPVKRTFFRGREVYVRRYPPVDPSQLPPFTSLPQVEIERYLYEACLQAGVEFAWSQRVEDVEVKADGVRLSASSGVTWEAPYVVAADGARSDVRRAVGIRMEGSRSANAFVVVDVQEDLDHPLPLERVFHYQHPAVDGRNVLFVPFSGGWRIDLQLFEDDNEEAFSGVDGVRSWLPRVMDKKYADRITWVSTYQFLQVVAASFTDEVRRVLLVGEAAHLFAPFGARGLNSGVADAVSAARAIARALETASASEARRAVEEFAEERRRAALYNRNAAGIALEHLQGTSIGMRMKRYAGAVLSPIWQEFGRWLDEGPYGPKSGPPGLDTKY